jgi:hypothetical protein
MELSAFTPTLALLGAACVHSGTAASSRVRKKPRYAWHYPDVNGKRHSAERRFVNGHTVPKGAWERLVTRR